MATREEALDQIVAIARSHGLTASEVSAALDVDRTGAGQPKAASLVGRILGYLGGIFIFAGLGVFIALNWDAMNAVARIIVTLGSGLAAFVIALVAAGDQRFTQARTPLYLIAALLQPTGILIAIDEFSSGGDWHYAVLLTTGLMLLQQGVVFWKKKDSTLLFTTLIFVSGFYGVLLDLYSVDEKLIAMTGGISLLALCMGLDQTRYRGLTPFWYFVGSVSFFTGLFMQVQHTSIELSFMLAATGGVLLSVYVRSRMLLFVSTLAMLGYISYFTGQHFLDSMGWPLMLIVLGLVLIGFSAVAIRINRRYIAGNER
ncbi:MAG TPA: DUF2157 domain-containing protein [Chromatiales bacterium]|nr:DUF2157 domain-containing protein [Chromatiales bacterium]